MYEKNHQELYSSRTHTSRGQSVLQWLAGWFGVLMDFIIIKPLRSEFYFENIKLSYWQELKKDMRRTKLT